MKLLTKSGYIMGLQCPRLLWTYVNDRDSLPDATEFEEFIMDQGTSLGELAKELFPGGVDIETDNFMWNIKKTKKLVEKRKILFEAGFRKDNLFSRADILVPFGKDKWDIIEVKGSTKVKDEHVDDVAFQKLCYEKSGLKIHKCYLMHINREYVRKGSLDVSRLFVKEDITADVALRGDISSSVSGFLSLINSKKPSMDLLTHDFNPKECVVCGSHVPSVFNLYRGGQKCFELYSSGVRVLKDVPSSFKLTDKQKIQVNCAKEGKKHIDKVHIANFIKKLKEPLYFMDFETVGLAIPPFEGVRPYQSVPFQFSVHVLDKHYSFLGSGSSDPRKEFLKELKKALGSSGSILVWNQSFEKAVLTELGLVFPDYKEWIDSVLKRIVDLIIPFKNFYYYDPKQCGSASIKKVLPVMTSHDYSGLDINEGGSAQLAYIKLMRGSVGNVSKVRKNLLEYCELDTKAMVWILEKLRDV